MKKWLLICLLFGSFTIGEAKHRRDATHLPTKEKEFAQQLSIKQRKIFCGRFNAKQREMAIRYTRGRGKDQCPTPDEAVMKVMEDTGMSLAVKGRREMEQR